jgi:HK97 family phage major capsid protein
MNIFELREKSTKIAHEARGLLDTIKADGSNEAEVTAQFDTMMTESDGYAERAARAEKAEARSNAFEAIVTDIASGKVESRKSDTNEEQRAAAFNDYLRGKKSISELRAMGVTGQDGVITPATFTTSLLTHLVTEGPMLDPTLINLLVTSTGNDIAFPTFNDNAKAIIIAENTQMPETDLGFGSKIIGAHKYTSKIVRVSNELLQDAAVNVADIVSKALAKRIGRGVNEHLTIGTGSGQPEGIVTAAEKVTTASATGIAVDELFALQHKIDFAYRGSASWMFNDATLLKVRTMRDGDGNLIWQPGLTVGAPATILGNRYVINPDMAGFATGNVVALFGDMKSYTVRRAKDIYVRRLEERYADYDQTAFVALARFDGALLDTSAVKALKLA